MVKDTKISIIGAGQFGFYISKHLDESEFNNIHLYDANREIVNKIKAQRKHPLHFHDLDASLSEKIILESDLEKAVKDSKIIFAAVPAQHMREAIKNIKPHIEEGAVLINVAKALELKTKKRMDEVFRDELGDFNYKCAALAGAMIAKEGIKGHPLSAEIASDDENVANYLSLMFGNKRLRLEPTTDLIGVELAGALKNVYAIAGGICYQLYGASSASTLLSKCSQEGGKFAIEYGAYGETFRTGGLAWLADLAVTFNSGRNSKFGREIVKKGSVDKALEQMKKDNYTVEGYATTKAVNNLARKYRGNYPILKSIHKVLYKGKDPAKAGDTLMTLAVE